MPGDSAICPKPGALECHICRPGFFPASEVQIGGTRGRISFRHRPRLFGTCCRDPCSGGSAPFRPTCKRHMKLGASARQRHEKCSTWRVLSLLRAKVSKDADAEPRDFHTSRVMSAEPPATPAQGVRSGWGSSSSSAPRALPADWLAERTPSIRHEAAVYPARTPRESFRLHRSGTWGRLAFGESWVGRKERLGPITS